MQSSQSQRQPQTTAREVAEEFAHDAVTDTAEHFEAAAELGGNGDSPASEPHAISLDLDVDAEDLEAIVQGVRDALVEEES